MTDLFYLDQKLDDIAMEKSISEGLQHLERCKVKFIAMPCNTAHIYFEKLKNVVQVPLLNQIEETVKRIKLSSKTVTVLGTRPTIESDLYQEKLREKGFKFELNSNWIDETVKIISKIKAGGITESVVESWKKLINDIEGNNVKAVLIACTDLTPLAQFKLKIDLIDSSLALAEETVSLWNSMR